MSSHDDSSLSAVRSSVEGYIAITFSWGDSTCLPTAGDRDKVSSMKAADTKANEFAAVSSLIGYHASYRAARTEGDRAMSSGDGNAMLEYRLRIVAAV